MVHTNQQLQDIFPRLNAIRTFIVVVIAMGYASTMARGPQTIEYFTVFGIEPGWIGVQLLFFFSGFLALRSLRGRHSPSSFLISRAKGILPLLALITLCVVIIIYPLVGVSSGSLGQDIKKLVGYFVTTLICYKPGQPLPGLLDDAHYACLIQGAIWTLRWGALFYLLSAVAHGMTLLKSNRLIWVMGLISIIAYAVVLIIRYRLNPGLSEHVFLAVRLGFPFALGFGAYALYEAGRMHSRHTALIALVALGLSCINYMFLPWTPFIEICLTISAIAVSLWVLFHPAKKLHLFDGWWNLALPLYLINWPISQLILYSNPDISSWGLIGTSLTISLILSVLLNRAVHAPLQRVLTLKTNPS